MTTQGIILVLISAFTHAAWNLLSKSSGDPVSFLRMVLRYATLCYLPFFLVFQFYCSYTGTVLACIVGSGVTIAFYIICLSQAYRHGQVSVAYPIARSFPILVVAGAMILWGRAPSPTALGGMLLVVAGCFVLPLKRFRMGPDGLAFRNYMNRSCFWAILTALLTTVYSLIDKHAAVSIPEQSPGMMVLARANYVYVQNCVAWVTLEFVMRLRKQPLNSVRRLPAIFAGLIYIGSYTLVIVAMATDPVAYVVSFRQVSILITAVLAMLLIERSVSRPRLLGVCMIFGGVVLVGLAK